MHKIVKFLFVLTILSFAFTQVSIKSTPKSVINNLESNMPKMLMPEIDHQSFLLEDEIEQLDKSIPYRFGAPFEVNYNLNNSGQWIEINEG